MASKGGIMPHISFIQAFTVVVLVWSLVILLIGIRLSHICITDEPVKPRHMREAEEVAAQRWKAIEQKSEEWR